MVQAFTMGHIMAITQPITVGKDGITTADPITGVITTIDGGVTAIIADVIKVGQKK